ncbi:hypothetical protein [Flagellimonas flava]|uniref:hypothetical protein n=1 Tax=Flagellimonas flava TaxID=570519 RepID=UPI003D648285
MERKFEEYFAEYCRIKYDATYNIRKVLKLRVGQVYIRWDEMPLSMQWGILQDFFLENRLLVEIRTVDDWNTWVFQIFTEDCMAPFFHVETSEEYGSINEARTAAFEKAKQLYEQRTK